MNAKKWWQEFDLEPGASLEDLRRARKDLLFVWHPDRMPERLRDLATERCQRINAAYEALTAGGEELENQSELVEAECRRCGGLGDVATGLDASGQFVRETCPTCRGAGTLICVASSRCRSCAGDGRDEAAKTVQRLDHVRSHLGALPPGSRAWRRRYRRLLLRYDNEVLPCRTCGGAGFTFFRPDGRSMQTASVKHERRRSEPAPD
jgi:hypothetical protein